MPRRRTAHRVRSRWPGCWPKEPWIVPIPGTTKLHRLAENIGALDVTLVADELAQLTEASSDIKIEGGRYPDFLEAQTNL